MMNVLAIATGGAVGSVLRYSIQQWLNLSFPYGTLAANILGCFIAGWLMALAVKGLNGQSYLFLMTGFCGGFTTFSAFSVESVQLMTAGRYITFSTYILASIAGGLLATFAAYKIFSA